MPSEVLSVDLLFELVVLCEFPKSCYELADWGTDSHLELKEGGSDLSPGSFVEFFSEGLKLEVGLGLGSDTESDCNEAKKEDGSVFHFWFVLRIKIFLDFYVSNFKNYYLFTVLTKNCFFIISLLTFIFI